MSSLFDKYLGSISGRSKGFLLRNLTSPSLFGCNRTGAMVIVLLCEMGTKYSL